MKKYFFGIDTSNYMTSVCFIDENRNVIYERRKLLEVKQGERGLKQSDAVFQHIKNIPQLFEDAKGLAKEALKMIAVSETPRPVRNSYMPVFLPGLSIAKSISSIYDVPLAYTTHQEGHIAAGLYSIDEKPEGNDFLAVHLSGGTSEILHLHKKSVGYNIKMIGASLDLHVGQLIDRIDVALGLTFPAGKAFEDLAYDCAKDFPRLPSSIKDYSFNLSGAEAKAIKMIEQGFSNQEIARSIEDVISVSITKILKKAIEAGLPKEILLVGGVAQNQYFRDYLFDKLCEKDIGAKLYFAKKEYSGDNAFGVANIALDQYLFNDKNEKE